MPSPALFIYKLGIKISLYRYIFNTNKNLQCTSRMVMQVPKLGILTSELRRLRSRLQVVLVPMKDVTLLHPSV